jgi:glycerol-3-phosphate acyltransferase PlsX
MTSTRIAIDAMGGDHAPEAIVAGAARACSTEGGGIDPERLLLVGDRARLEPLVAELPISLEIQHASEVIEMGESPSKALRAKPDSSIGGCVKAVKLGSAAAIVSMGNTGAVVGASTLGLGTLEGVRRPGIAVTMDLTGHPVTILDMGANIAPKPEHLVQYAQMGSVFTNTCVSETTGDPRIALLNIGTESSKGTALLKETFPLLEAAPINFVGNVEGGDLFRNVADVVITDGFTGNVVLKLLEEFSGFMLGLVMKQLTDHKVDWGMDALSKVRKQIDYAEYGGAMLLGVNGVVVIGHGRSDDAAVSNAIALAARAIDASVNDAIIQGMA